MADRYALSLHKLLDDLVAQNRLSREQANKVAGATRSRDELDMHPINYLATQELEDQVNAGRVLSEEALCQWLADQAGLPLFRIDPLKIRASVVTGIMSFAFAKRHHILCVEVRPMEVVIAVADPFQHDWEDQIAQVTQKKVTRVLSNPKDIARYAVEFYSLSRSVTGADGNTNAVSESANFEQLLELGTLKDPEANDQHVVNIVDWLLQYAFDQRASDIHIEPRRELSRLRFRIDGVLHTVYELPLAVTLAVISRLKILGRMNVAEKRKPQDGRIKTKRDNGQEVELRLSTLPTAFGEKMVMRIFDPEVLLRSFKDLGLGGDDLSRWQHMTSQAHGIVLVTGPTGSGKTTTLYSSLKHLATDKVNVSTIEDPIEMVEEQFNQTQVQPNINLDFAAGIRTLMRQDPDIIMVGEIRDRETAQMAVQAALTGHLVLSTLHTNDAPSAVTRLLDLGLPSFLIKSTVLGVMAQRLVRTLCPHCKEIDELDASEWAQLVKPWKAARPPCVYKAVGCLECRNTGYLGRQGIYEILKMSPALSEMITDQCDIDHIRKLAIKEGMHSLRLSGAQKIAKGLTTVAEVLRVVPL